MQILSYNSFLNKEIIRNKINLFQIRTYLVEKTGVFPAKIGNRYLYYL